jgi:hypothetical protein
LELLARLIRQRIEKDRYCTVFEYMWELVWPREQPEGVNRIEEIHAFAKAHGWFAEVSYPDLDVTFRELPA